ncbi:MAG: hypothetical protein JSV17_02595 [Candidatus Aminicenantes bacterium]|nr:MAG: hypothetical protein JSV17_02595 [Candidatus Aminicenantes bacterium]
MNRTRTLHSILLLSGAFIIAFNLAVAFHELGHATAVLIDGGQIQEFVLNPFSWSWNLGRGVRDVLFTAWGGVTIGLVYTVVPLLFIRLVKHNGMKLVIKLLAGLGFLINGIYLIIGVIFNVGDGAELTRLGVSPVLVLVMGIAFVFIALIIWSKAQGNLGIAPRERFSCRLLVLITGVAPYMAMIVLYNYQYNSEQLVLWGGFAATGVAAAGLFALCGHLWAKQVSSGSHPIEVSGLSGFIMMLMGILMVMAEFLVFGTPQHPF